MLKKLKARGKNISKVEFFSISQWGIWLVLGVDLEVESLKNPEMYPLTYKLRNSLKRCSSE